MNCSDLIAHFTDYLDGSAPVEDVRAMEAHLAGCDSCRRYGAVLEYGSSLLKSLPSAELREDFGPRLQHRLYHVHEERSLPEHVASGAPALTVLGIAVLLAAVAWTPTLRSSPPVIELAPIVVDRAPPRVSSPSGRMISAPLGQRDPNELNVDLWDDARLYEYSSLNPRQRSEAQPRQVGFAPNQ